MPYNNPSKNFKEGVWTPYPPCIRHWLPDTKLWCGCILHLLFSGWCINKGYVIKRELLLTPIIRYWHWMFNPFVCSSKTYSLSYKYNYPLVWIIVLVIYIIVMQFQNKFNYPLIFVDGSRAYINMFTSLVITSRRH